MSRILSTIALLTAALITPPMALANEARAPKISLIGDGGVPDFYRWDGNLSGKPGKLLRFEAMTEKAPLENAAQSIRILYSSTDGVGGKARVAGSGALYIPKGIAPKGGWPLLAWAHGTVGVADICAPSFTGRFPRDVIYLNHWLSKGYAVVASDYQGLGTPGGHPYLLTRPVAYSVLDSIRAVQGKSFGLAKKVVLIGQSQGGAAAFATAGYAKPYAPELNIRGAVATGTPYFSIEGQKAIDTARPVDKVDPLVAYNFLFYSALEQLEPGFALSDQVTEKAMPIASQVGQSCFFPLAQQSVKSGLTRANSFKIDSLEGLSRHVERLGYRTLKLTIPIFMGAGGTDRDVPPAMQMGLAREACAAGSVIEAHVYPGLDHSGAVNGSTGDSTAFIAKAFAGEKISGNCAGLPKL
jgi:pimeloyl-ACP methyl ester carboxylesterase